MSEGDANASTDEHMATGRTASTRGGRTESLTANHGSKPQRRLFSGSRQEMDGPAGTITDRNDGPTGTALQDLLTCGRKYRNEARQFQRSGLKPLSSFTPNLEVVGPEVAIFEKSVVQKFEDMLRHIPRFKYNLDKEENKFLHNLIETNKITVKPCDKGGGLICQKEYELLTPDYTRVLIIYGLPKVHKDVKDPSLRPIVSMIGSAIEPLSKYVDPLLKPLVSQLLSYIFDTGHFISKLEGLQYNPEQEILVPMDLEALYTNIPQQQALDCVASYLIAASEMRSEDVMYTSFFYVDQNPFQPRSFGTFKAWKDTACQFFHC
ncbi:hypothetical protein NDU88_008996 [Pleurodeles waltl]|uniref:Uncharacterized protein n=1 Tax=Pleurodeles waltl TaxID=8319 RepID=A0AAV7P0K0_PLEWA|nr:hypothetical protein NDU88_008996 [Pleurodeles waltl]